MSTFEEAQEAVKIGKGVWRTRKKIGQLVYDSFDNKFYLLGGNNLFPITDGSKISKDWVIE